MAGGARKRVIETALPAWKKALFSIVAVGGFFLLLETALSLAGVLPQLAYRDPYVGFSRNVPLFVEETGSDGRTYLKTSPAKTAWFNRLRFLKDKPEGVFRIVAVGGSTTYGRPFDDALSFSGRLREFLPLADPTQQWEVVNAGGVSYASYRVAAVVEEIARYQPDLIVVYSGHNEFLERRTYRGLIEAPRPLTWVGGLLSRTRTYAAGAQLLERAMRKNPSRDILADEVDAMLARSIGPEDYARDDAFHAQVLAHYRFNLLRIAALARDAGARTIFVTPASNLKDCSPFKSEAGAGVDAAQLEALLAQARQARERGDLAQAGLALEQALRMDARYAATHYERGRNFLAQGRAEEAREAFLRAVAEDVCPLRATPEMLDIVRDVAAEAGARLVDFAAYIDRAAPAGIPGAEAFLDHVHLNLERYGELALLLVDELERAGVLHKAETWTEDTIAREQARAESRLDRQALAKSLKNLARVFSWAGKMEEASRIARRSLEEIGDSADAYFTLGRSAQAAGRTDEAIAHLRQAIEVDAQYADAHVNLGALLLDRGETEAAMLHLRKALALDPRESQAHVDLGVALARGGDAKAALGHYEAALRIDPRSVDAHINLGAELVSRGDVHAGIGHFRQALKLKPGLADARVNLGYALTLLGRLDEAESELRRALETGPETAAMHFNLGAVLQKKGAFEAAVAAYRRALRLDPGLSGAARNLAGALLELGRDDEALAELRRALRRDPGFAEAYPEIRELLETP